MGQVMGDVTRILAEVQRGDRWAAEDILPLVYDELRSLARTRLKYERPGQSLQPTALVHEAYLRLVGDEDPGWDGRGHFFAAAARAMRQLLVDRARQKLALKRGNRQKQVSLEYAEPALEPPAECVLAVDEALHRLEVEDARKGQIVNLRFFSRMTTAETAAALGISVATVGREWRYIRAWLECELQQEGASRVADGTTPAGRTPL